MCTYNISNKDRVVNIFYYDSYIDKILYDLCELLESKCNTCISYYGDLAIDVDVTSGKNLLYIDKEKEPLKSIKSIDITVSLLDYSFDDEKHSNIAEDDLSSDILNISGNKLGNFYYDNYFDVFKVNINNLDNICTLIGFADKGIIIETN